MGAEKVQSDSPETPLSGKAVKVIRLNHFSQGRQGSKVIQETDSSSKSDSPSGSPSGPESVSSTIAEVPGKLTRWNWRKLMQAQTVEQFKEALADAASRMGEGDVELALQFSPPEYLKLMELTWLAYKAHEISEGTGGALVDRALQVYQLYLKQRFVGQKTT